MTLPPTVRRLVALARDPRRVARAVWRRIDVAVAPWWRRLDVLPRRWADRDDESTLRVSVIVPVYNAGEYLEPLLDSLRDQDLDPDDFEVIAIDDGSTDGSGAVLDSYAGRMPNLRVVHQENSGWPGQPRNRGIEMSRGRYVFFADADDIVGREALRRLVEFADRYHSDVVVPKLTGLDGRWVRQRIFRDTQIVADLELAFKALGPTKLFRRRLLIDGDLRFPTGRVRLEDGMFVAEAMHRARRVSILSGYDFYHARLRADRGSLTQLRFDPDGYSWSVGEVARIIRAHDPDPERADRIVLDLYRRKCLKVYEPRRFLNWYDDDTRRKWIEAHGLVIAAHIPVALEATLPSPFLERSRAVRTGDLETVMNNCRAEGGGAAQTAS